MKLKLETLAGNHQFHHLTGKHKKFNVTVATKFSTHAKIKYTELYLIGLDLLFSALVCVTKIHQFLPSGSVAEWLACWTQAQ